jgi:hypothetical protein
MIKLVNGRGQIGSALSEMLSKVNIDIDVYIYHTWNIDDKTRKAQAEQYKKFIEFVDNHKAKKIVFISTSSQKNNWYTYYKHFAESYLLLANENSVVIRLPTLIGKGVFSSFKHENAVPYGTIELMSIEEAANIIIEKAVTSETIKNFHVSGEEISAKYVRQLILFGKDNE